MMCYPVITAAYADNNTPLSHRVIRNGAFDRSEAMHERIFSEFRITRQRRPCLLSGNNIVIRGKNNKKNRITKSHADNDPGPPRRVIRKERENHKSPTHAARENKNRITHTQAKRLLSVLLSVIRGKHQHLFELRCEKCTKPRPADLICSPRKTIHALRGFCYPASWSVVLKSVIRIIGGPGVIRKAQNPGVIRSLSEIEDRLLRAPRLI